MALKKLRTKKAIIHRKVGGNYDKQFRFVLHSGNGKVVAESKDFYKRLSTLMGILKRNFPDFEISYAEPKKKKNV